MNIFRRQTLPGTSRLKAGFIAIRTRRDPIGIGHSREAIKKRKTLLWDPMEFEHQAQLDRVAIKWSVGVKLALCIY